MTPFPPVEVTVYPYDCDAFGHLNQAAMLTLLERARWDALARGPGMDLFDRNGVWPVVRKTTIEYQGPAYARDVLRVETVVVHRGTTSMTLRHVVRRISDEVQVAEAEMVFVCVDRLGRATPLADEIARYLGPPPPRPGAGHQPLRVSVGDAELAVEVRGEGLPVVFVHGFPSTVPCGGTSSRRSLASGASRLTCGVWADRERRPRSTGSRSGVTRTT